MKKTYLLVFIGLACLAAVLPLRAQDNYFRVINGIPHLPVVANTTAVTSPVTGAMVFSQAHAQAMVYNGAAWYNLAELPDPVGTDSEPYFRVVNGMPCMAVITSASGWSAELGLVYYSDYGDMGLMVADGAMYNQITTFFGLGMENEKAMVSSGIDNLLTMPVLNTAPTSISAGAFYMNATSNQFLVYDGSAWQNINTPPQVSNVTITGTIDVGKTLSLTYTYSDIENDAEGATTFQWYRATSSTGAGATAISGATAQSYTLTSAVAGYYIGVRVTPIASTGITTGNAITTYNSTVVATSACPSTLVVTHTAGGIAPLTQTTTYKSVEIDLSSTNGTKQCWLAQNLGATKQATSDTDDSNEAAGWYWQFNHKQGFVVNGSTRTPSTSWTASIDQDSDWTFDNDPCRQLLGGSWRIPTRAEWIDADAFSGTWGTRSGAYGSIFKLHGAGYLSSSSGILTQRGGNGLYWTSTQNSTTRGHSVYLSTTSTTVGGTDSKAYAFAIRCLTDL